MMLWMLVVLALDSSAVGQRVVDTQYGPVRGHAVDVDNGREQTQVEVYFGVRYGADTSGANRFRSPQPPTPWTEIFEADTRPMECAQGGSTNNSATEDCLKVNIFAPTDTSQTYPVMVWIHGGGYQSGAATDQGHFLASRGIILVSVFYRLGNLGFAFTNNDACPGNAGMWDQNAAIKFVADNIAGFGGDPTKITVFGQSAGGTSVSLHVLSPHSNQLFHQAIVQSGPEQVFWALNPPEAQPENQTYALAENLGCDGLADDYAMMDCMRNLPWEEVADARVGGCTRGYPCMGMVPVVDGAGGFMPQMPAQQRLDGEVMSGPIMSGICKEDGSYFSPIVAPAIVSRECCNRTYFEHSIENNMVYYYSGRFSNQTADDMFEAINWFYSPWPHIYDEEANRLKLVELVTDAAFGAAWEKQVRDHQEIAPTYSYLFDYMSNRSSNADWVGTPHSAENEFVFGNPLLIFNPDVRNDTGNGGGVPTQTDIDFSIFIEELWTNFAKYGNPTQTPVENPLNGGSFTWPQFTVDELNYNYMGDTTAEIRQEYRVQDYSFWNFYTMGIAGEEMGIAQYWDVYAPYDQVSDAELLLESWRAHQEKFWEMLEH